MKLGRVLITIIFVLMVVGLAFWRNHRSRPPVGHQDLRVEVADSFKAFADDFNGLFAQYWVYKSKSTVGISTTSTTIARSTATTQPSQTLHPDVRLAESSWELDRAAAEQNLLPAAWQSRLPKRSCPFFSTVVWVVKSPGAKNLKSWSDLLRADVVIVTVDPAQSATGQWVYSAMLGGLRREENHSGELVDGQLRDVFGRAKLYATTNAATKAFADGTGDVLLAWESDAMTLAAGREGLTLVTPPTSIRVEPPVSMLDLHADAHNVREVAEAYVEFMYTERAQRLAVKHHLRPTIGTLDAESNDRFPTVELFTIDELGGWATLAERYFRGPTSAPVNQREGQTSLP